jgi:hypothetical protein
MQSCRLFRVEEEDSTFFRKKLVTTYKTIRLHNPENTADLVTAV